MLFYFTTFWIKFHPNKKLFKKPTSIQGAREMASTRETWPSREPEFSSQ